MSEPVSQRCGGDEKSAASWFDERPDLVEQIATDVDGITGAGLPDDDERIHFFSAMPSSSSCLSSTVDGASLIRSCARAVFGNAMTSRSDSARAIIITMRSTPRAMPPCGGAPKRKA